MSLDVERIKEIPKLTAQQYIEKLFSGSADEYTMIAHAGTLGHSIHIDAAKMGEGIIGLNGQDRK